MGHDPIINKYSQAKEFMPKTKSTPQIKRINLSSFLPEGEFIKGFDLGASNFLSWGRDTSIAFWTQNQDNKYHIYTAGFNENGIGRETKTTKADTFAKIINPNKKNESEKYDFDKVKSLSINYWNIGIWTEDEKSKDHIYFSGVQQYGQFGLGNQQSYNSYLVDATKNIFSSIGLDKKIKNVYFKNGKSDFILTEDNKLFDTGKNAHGEIQGDLRKKFITKFTIVDTSMLKGANIKQISVQETSFNTDPGILVVTDNNQLWVMGYNPSYKNGNNKFGLKTPDYFGNLKQVPLNNIISPKETILYATSYGSYECSIAYIAYSILITKNELGNNKIYMCGGSIYNGVEEFHSADTKNYGWAYNDELTKKIFGEDTNSGIYVEFKNKNLGNCTNSLPISSTSTSIIAFGKVKKDKDTKNQEESLVFGSSYQNSWKTSIVTSPIIDNASLNILEGVDPLDNKKYLLTYSFNIKTFKNKIDYKNCLVNPPKEKIGDEKYNFIRGNEKGEGIKVTISNIPKLKYSIFNGNGHKFILHISYKDKDQHSMSKDITNSLDSFTIHKPLKIKNIQYEPIKMYKDSFTLSFKIEKELNGHVLKGSYGEQHLLFNAKFKENSELQKLGARLKLTKFYYGHIPFFQLTVYNLPKKKATYNVDNSIYLEASYSDVNNKKIGWGTWKSNEDKNFNLGMVTFDPLFIIPPTLSITQIILIVFGGLMIAFIFAGMWLMLLRKKDAKAFANYEAKQMSLDSESYSLATVVQERTKKQTRQAIKDWKKLIKKDKEFE